MSLLLAVVSLPPQCSTSSCITIIFMINSKCPAHLVSASPPTPPFLHFKMFFNEQCCKWSFVFLTATFLLIIHDYNYYTTVLQARYKHIFFDIILIVSIKIDLIDVAWAANHNFWLYYLDEYLKTLLGLVDRCWNFLFTYFVNWPHSSKSGLGIMSLVLLLCVF